MKQMTQQKIYLMTGQKISQVTEQRVNQRSNQKVNQVMKQKMNPRNELRLNQEMKLTINPRMKLGLNQETEQNKKQIAQCYVNWKSVMRTVAALLILFFPTVLQAQDQLSLPERGKQYDFTYNDYAPFAQRPVGVHYYLPSQGDVKKMPIVFVFEGGDRGYTYLMEGWKKEADKRQFIVVTPHFGLKEFPLYLYQEIGVTDSCHNQIRPEEELTPVLVDKIFEVIKQRIGSERRGYSIYGHSAGGQFVHRFMLFHDSPYVERAITASPGWLTFPDSTILYPYGVKNVPYITKERLRRFIEKPVVLHLGLGDTIRESFLRKTPEAEAQGNNRLTRGRSFYRFLQRMAIENGWKCNWTKVEEPGIGHESVSMGIRGASILMQDPLYNPMNSTDTPTLLKNQSPLSDEGNRLALPDEVDRWFYRLASQYPEQVNIHRIGETPKGHFPLCVEIGHRDKQKLHIWMQGALHGNEPASTESLCKLALWLLSSEEGKQALEKISLTLVPIANVDGYSVGQRKSGSGLDLNRDQSKLLDPVTHLLKQCYAHSQPDIAVDLHEYRPLRKEFEALGKGAAAHACDVLMLPSGHLQIPEELRSLSNELFFPEAERALEEKGYVVGPYFTPATIHSRLYAVKGGKSPQSSVTFQGLTGAISLFFEIKGIGLDHSTFARRTDCGFLAAQSVVRTAVLHKDMIQKQMAKTRKETLKGKRPVYVTFEPDSVMRNYRFISPTEGNFEVALPTLDALTCHPKIVRKRPAAYLLPANCRKAVEKLHSMGIEVRRYNKECTLDVEEYTVTRLYRDDKSWEGIHRVDLTTELHQTKHTFHADDYLIPLNQPLGNLICTLLEPESACGFVRFAVLSANQGETLPIFRLGR